MMYFAPRRALALFCGYLVFLSDGGGYEDTLSLGFWSRFNLRFKLQLTTANILIQEKVNQSLKTSLFCISPASASVYTEATKYGNLRALLQKQLTSLHRLIYFIVLYVR